jgi:hypothetical protein
MKTFLNKLISSNTEESSKRFVSVVAFFCIIILCFIATFSKEYVCPEFMFDALCLISGGGLGLTVIEKIFEKKSNVQKLD